MKVLNFNLEVAQATLFTSSVMISAVISYLFWGMASATWCMIACIYTFNLFMAQDTFKNLRYTSLGLILIIVSGVIGHILTLSLGLYIYLALFSFFYYQFYGIDPMLDLTMKFMILMATIATVLKNISFSIVLGFVVGSAITLVSCYLFSKKNRIKRLYIRRIFMQRHLFMLHRHILLRSTTYAIGLMMTLILPQMLSFTYFYWTLLTYIFVLHPKSLDIVHITLQRIIGSVCAVVFLFFLFNFFPMPYVGFVIIPIATFVYPISRSIGYGFMTFVTSTLVLALLELIGYWSDPTYSILIDRILETCLGGGIAYIASLILRWFREPSLISTKP